MSAVQLNEDELAELDAFLLSELCDDDTLSVDEVHGYLTALIVADDKSKPAQWLETAWGEPNFSDDAMRERMTALMLRLHDDLAAGLAAGQTFEPLVVEVEDEGEDVIAYEGWCFGFMLGVEQQQQRWEALAKDEQGLLTPIAQLALLNSEEPPDMDEEEYDSWVELIPGAVTALYRRWH